jgi:hypothetical protein
MRIFLAALLGAIAMFIWMSIAHMALPLGEAGIREVPNESFLGLMQAQLGDQSGLYMFPGFGLGPNPTKEQQHEAMKHMDERAARFPSGILMYFPPGGRPMMMGKWLSIEFVTEFFETLLAVWMLSCTRLVSYGARVGFILVAGILAGISTNISYWNWYGFPAVYTCSYIFTQVVGFLCAGLVVALVLKNWRPAP